MSECADMTVCAGLWDGYDWYAGWGVAQAAATLGAGLLTLSLSRTLRSAHSMPVTLNTIE